MWHCGAKTDSRQALCFRDLEIDILFPEWVFHMIALVPSTLHFAMMTESLMQSACPNTRRQMRLVQRAQGTRHCHCSNFQWCAKKEALRLRAPDRCAPLPLQGVGVMNAICPRVCFLVRLLREFDPGHRRCAVALWKLEQPSSSLAVRVEPKWPGRQAVFAAHLQILWSVKKDRHYFLNQKMTKNTIVQSKKALEHWWQETLCDWNRCEVNWENMSHHEWYLIWRWWSVSAAHSMAADNRSPESQNKLKRR